MNECESLDHDIYYLLMNFHLWIGQMIKQLGNLNEIEFAFQQKQQHTQFWFYIFIFAFCISSFSSWTIN